jgi:prepilin-type N-terminal cleavage/methylation domain-containing protein
MTHRLHTDERGFTLIEVIVAALVLVLAFTALAVIFINGQNESSAAVEQSQLINVADQQIEQVRGQVNNGGFNALGLSAVPTVASQFKNTDGTAATIQSTYKDPDAFTFTTGTASCFDINRNYDGASAANFATETPPAFVQWSNCSTYGEPLQTLGTTAMVQSGTLSSGAAVDPNGGTLPNGVAVHACSTSTSSTIYSPCFAEFNSTYVNVYTFVTDTYIGCGTGTTGTGTGVITTASGASCPAVSGAAVQVQSASPACAFPTTSAASTPCGDSRRVTVAADPVQVHQGLGRLTPVYISTIFTNPDPTTTSASSIGLTLAGAL